VGATLALTQLHIINVWGFLFIAIDKSDKSRKFLLLEAGNKVAGRSRRSESHWDIWRRIAIETSNQWEPFYVSDDKHRFFYGWPLAPLLLEMLGDHLNAVSALGYKHGEIEAMSMQAALPGLN
jgi:hypothetical protein